MKFLGITILIVCSIAGSFGAHARAYEGDVPTFAKNDELLSRAYESGDSRLIDMIEKQERENGSEALSGAQFRRRLRAALDDNRTEATYCADCRAAQNTGNRNFDTMSSLSGALGGLLSNLFGGGQMSTYASFNNPMMTMYDGYNYRNGYFGNQMYMGNSMYGNYANGSVNNQYSNYWSGHNPHMYSNYWSGTNSHNYGQAPAIAGSPNFSVAPAIAGTASGSPYTNYTGYYNFNQNYAQVATNHYSLINRNVSAPAVLPMQ